MEKGVDILKKKLLISFLLIISLLNITGCSYITNFLNDKKPTNFYYTNGLISFYKQDKPQAVKVFYSDLYKERSLDKSNYEDIENFLNELKSELFIEKPSNLPEVPIYKIFIEFENIKYVINVYNEKFISIYPWDGKYDMDYVDMTKIPIAYNLYGLCKYFLPE